MATLIGETFPGDGATRQFNITFPYLSRDHVKLTVDGVEVPFVFLSPTLIEAATAPAGGTEVNVFRDTILDDDATEFNDGALLTAAELNRADLRLLYRQQEVDGRVASVPDLAALQAAANAGAVAAAEAQAAAQAATQAAAEAQAALEAATTGTPVDWTSVLNKPATFPPSPHTHPYLPIAGGTLEGDLIGELRVAGALGGVFLKPRDGGANYGGLYSPSTRVTHFWHEVDGNYFSLINGEFTRSGKGAMVHMAAPAHSGGGKITVSTADPSGGVDGDIWYKV